MYPLDELWLDRPDLKDVVFQSTARWVERFLLSLPDDEIQNW